MSEQTRDQAETTLPPRRILIVEDEFLIRLTLSEVLSDEGYEVLEAETGDDALEILVRHARQTRPDLPVIFMTGRPDTIAGQITHPHEMFVAKPYLPSEICRAVKRMLEG